MKKIIGLVMLTYITMPTISLATTINNKTIVGTVTSLSGNSINLKTTTAAVYSADITTATLTRKNGSPMQLVELLVGDKVEVTGRLWTGNSISATVVKDDSLYAHTGTFTGKISNINTSNSSFTLDGKTYGTQTITTNSFTAFKKNGSAASFSSLQLGMTATVKGVWDRSRVNVAASSIDANFRLINISFIGTLSIMNGAALTVIGSGNEMYGVDAASAKILSKNGKALTLAQFRLGDVLKISGKHISGMGGVTATEIKDTSLSK